MTPALGSRNRELENKLAEKDARIQYLTDQLSVLQMRGPNDTATGQIMEEQSRHRRVEFDLMNKLSASEARVAMLEKAQFRETPMVLDPNGDGQSYVTLGEYMDSAALDAAKEGK